MGAVSKVTGRRIVGKKPERLPDAGEIRRAIPSRLTADQARHVRRGGNRSGATMRFRAVCRDEDRGQRSEVSGQKSDTREE